MLDAVAEAVAHVVVPLGEDIWIVDARPIRAMGVQLPLRMVVIRLRDGALLLHSPILHSPELQRELEALGPVAHLVAPSVAHWRFLTGWQRACPRAKTWAAPGLGERRQVRAAGVRVDADLGGEAPDAWRGILDQVLFRAPGYAELAFHHRASRTVLVTDVVANVDGRALPPVSRLATTLAGLTAPHGRAPAQLRLLLRLNKRRNARAAARLVAFAPERVVPAHGMWFSNEATARLRRSLDWLLARDLQGSTVVVTGASSGIGRATALAFAREGARVVVAARRGDVLDDVVRECEALGAAALAVPTDVADAGAVEALATAARARFGGIDVWINNAGTGVFGAFQEAPVALHRRTIEVNLIGAINGAAAALPVFLRQGRGTLINTVSLGGWAPTPYAASYTATKWALRGLGASLRAELGPHRDIHVCGVFPSMVDTPGFVHGANVSGRGLNPGPFLYTAADVADTFVRVAKRPRDETAVGWPARAGQLAYTLAPGSTERLMGAAFRMLLSRAGPAPRTEGALPHAIAAGTTPDGGWLARKHLPSAKWLGAGVAAGLAVTALGLYAGTRRRRSHPYGKLGR